MTTKVQNLLNILNSALQESDPSKIHQKLEDAKSIVEDMTPSRRKQAHEEVEGQLETALWKYFQIKLAKNQNDYHHWRNALIAALKAAMQANKGDHPRGYWFKVGEIENILFGVQQDALDFAVGHLKLPAETEMPAHDIGSLFKEAGLQLPPEWK